MSETSSEDTCYKSKVRPSPKWPKLSASIKVTKNRDRWRWCLRTGQLNTTGGNLRQETWIEMGITMQMKAGIPNSLVLTSWFWASWFWPWSKTRKRHQHKGSQYPDIWRHSITSEGFLENIPKNFFKKKQTNRITLYPMILGYGSGQSTTVPSK